MFLIICIPLIIVSILISKLKAQSIPAIKLYTLNCPNKGLITLYSLSSKINMISVLSLFSTMFLINISAALFFP